MSLIAQTLSRLTLGPPTSFEALTLVPLLDARTNESHYVTLGDALGAGAIEITEVSEAGSVPSLKARNRSGRPVLILDGEELVGSRRSRHFAASKQTMHARGRRRNVRSVHQSLASEGTYRGDQQAVWREVDEKSRRMDVESPTGALGDVYLRYDAPLDSYSGSFRPHRGQRGAVFAVNGKIEGLELFDSAATYSRAQAKLIRSYAVDAIERQQTPESDAEPSAQAVEAFLAALSAAPVQRFPGVGMGETIRFQTNEVVGAGHAVNDALVHLTAFATID